MRRGLRSLLACFMGCLLYCLPMGVGAAEKIKLQALFKDKAILMIDGTRRVLSAGEVSPEGVKLLRTDTSAETAEIEIDGEAQIVELGIVNSVPSKPGSAGRSVTLWAEPNGFFHARGSINGIAVTFLVDTGANTVAMNKSTAVRLGVNYINGKPGISSTAGGFVRSYSVKLRSVKVGSILLHNIDASVIDGTHPEGILLGMSFLGRLDMRREGSKMELTQRY